MTTKEDEKYRQGKSKRQVTASYIGAFIGIAGLVILGILLLIFK